MNYQRICPYMILLAMCLPAAAAPLDPATVSADAKWLVHVDVEQLRNNPVAQMLREHVENDKKHKDLDNLRQIMGLESWDDLKSIVVYGRTDEPEEGVMIIRAKSDQQRVIESLSGKPTYSKQKHGDRWVHSWTETKERRGQTKQHTMFLMFYPGDYALLSRNRETFELAIDVLDQAKPGVSGGVGRLTAAAPPAASIYIEAAGPIKPKRARKEHIMQTLERIERFTLALTHGGADTSLQMDVQLDNADDAFDVGFQIKQLLEGLWAIMLLKQKDPGMVALLTDAMSITAMGQSVAARLTLPNDRLIEMIEGV